MQAARPLPFGFMEPLKCCEAARKEMPEIKQKAGEPPEGARARPSRTGTRSCVDGPAPSTPNVTVADQPPGSAVTRNQVGKRLANS